MIICKVILSKAPTVCISKRGSLQILYERFAHQNKILGKMFLKRFYILFDTDCHESRDGYAYGKHNFGCKELSKRT